jgi:hypothetical protein
MKNTTATFRAWEHAQAVMRGRAGGKVGGLSRSPAKRDASRRNVERARAVLAGQRSKT